MQRSTQERVHDFLEKNPVISLSNVFKASLSDPHCNDSLWSFSENELGKKAFSKEFLHTLLYVRNINKEVFHTIENNSTCAVKNWSAHEHNPDRKLLGGGTMSVLRADVLEKSAVNLSCVAGPSYPALEGEFAGKPFAATGVSLISHPRNPYAPIMHLNIRCIRVFHDGKITTWMGGGADLTPMIPFDEDAELFHKAMKEVCERNPKKADYDKYKKWADEYFYIPHRKEARGIGGIFFDFVPVETEDDFALLLDVGQYAARAYCEILSHRIDMPYNSALEDKHLYWRGRYAEFNLVYDRGTRFGLMTGGNYEAIFCSLPPRVQW